MAFAVNPVSTFRRYNVDRHYMLQWTNIATYDTNFKIVYDFYTHFGEASYWKLSIFHPNHPDNRSTTFSFRLEIVSQADIESSDLVMINKTNIQMAMITSGGERTVEAQAYEFAIDNSFCYTWKPPMDKEEWNGREINFFLKLIPTHLVEFDLSSYQDGLSMYDNYFCCLEDLQLLSHHLGNMYRYDEDINSRATKLHINNNLRSVHKFIVSHRWPTVFYKSKSTPEGLFINSDISIIDAIIWYCYTADLTLVKEQFSTSHGKKEMYKILQEYRMWRLYRHLTPDSEYCRIVTHNAMINKNFSVTLERFGDCNTDWKSGEYSFDLTIIQQCVHVKLQFCLIPQGDSKWLTIQVYIKNQMLHGEGYLSILTPSDGWLTDKKHFENDLQEYHFAISDTLTEIPCMFSFKGVMDSFCINGQPTIEEFNPLDGLHIDMRNACAKKIGPDASVLADEELLPIHSALLRHRLNCNERVYRPNLPKLAADHFIEYIYCGKINRNTLTPAVVDELLNLNDTPELFSRLRATLSFLK